MNRRALLKGFFGGTAAIAGIGKVGVVGLDPDADGYMITCERRLPPAEREYLFKCWKEFVKGTKLEGKKVFIFEGGMKLENLKG